MILNYASLVQCLNILVHVQAFVSSAEVLYQKGSIKQNSKLTHRFQSYKTENNFLLIFHFCQDTFL